MSPSARFDQVQALFDAAIERPPENRAAFLAEACAGDAELRAEVESLLQHDSRTAQGFLTSPVLDLRLATADSAQWAAKLIGRRIGRYTVVRLLGCGGMGCVFEARQERPARAVALKVLPPGLSAPSALARFRLEPEVLGRLQHPNIAQVFEAGVHQDEAGPVPYFAMEFIAEAQSLPDYADAQRLTTRQRLELFAKVCDAVHHGHQKGIIHRDLKPANILIGADGEPKVIDFGVARASDADILLTTQCTHAGDLVGTVHYMSPEQCDGDPAVIDTRSDIYSLGVVLYELLTGQAPYDTSGTTVYGAIRVIREELPRRPSTLTWKNERPSRGVCCDVDAILFKLLQKEPDRRYTSAAELAQDIRRHLAGEPIRARPPGRLAALVRWAVRNPAKVTGAACATVLAITVLTSSALAWVLSLRPDHVERLYEGKEIRLSTITDRPLKRWRSEKPALGAPILVDRRQKLGGGKLLLFGSKGIAANPNPYGLLVFDVARNLKEPLWVGSIEPDDIPEQLRRRSDFSFGPPDFWGELLLEADVFPDYPRGTAHVPEVVAVYSHTSTTHTAIRVHSLKGDVLYQVWIDVTISPGVVWLPRAGLLVFGGLNGEAFLEQRGIPGGGNSHAAVVFAIAPRLNLRENRYVPQEESERPLAEASLRCSWYYCVTPPEGYDAVVHNMTLQEGREDTETVRFDVSPGRYRDHSLKDCELRWHITAAGEPSGPYLSDFYRRNQTLPDGDPAKLPPPTDFELGPLPPILSRPTDG